MSLGDAALTAWPKLVLDMLPSTLAGPKNWAWLARLKASARSSRARLSCTNRVRESVASKLSLPGPEKKRRRALPMVPNAGRVS